MKLVAHRAANSVPPESHGEDPFAAFTSETAPAPPPKIRRPWPVVRWPVLRLPAVRWPFSARATRRVVIPALSVLVLTAVGIVVVWQISARRAGPPAGRLTVVTTPPGADVVIDGQQRGITPLTLDLANGTHHMILRRAGVTRELPVTSKSNVEVVQSVDLAPAPAASATGSLSITSEPSGMRVEIDGTVRGTTPALVGELPAGQHSVTISGKSGTTARSVVVQAGSTATLMVSMPAEAATARVGSVAISSPIDVQLFEGDTLVGSSRSARLFLAAGTHTITAVNDALGYKRSIAVDVKPGETSKLGFIVPDGALSVNAQPWAEVFVDGKSLGETPIGNYALPIGSHELMLRHPQFGERRQTVVIGVGRTARVGVDLRK